MKSLLIAFLVTFLAFCTNAKSILRKSEFKYEDRVDYVQTIGATPDEIHEVVVAIKHKNLDKLEETLYDVSTMTSPNYGKHKTRDEIGELIQNLEGTAAVKNWLQTFDVNIVDITPFGDFITVQAKVSTLEHALHAKFHEFRAVGEKRFHNRVIRSESYSIPEELDNFIHEIFHCISLPPVLTHFARFERFLTEEESTDNLNRLKSNNLRLSATSPYITPINLASIYNIVEPAVNTQVSQAAYVSLFIYLSYLSFISLLF